MKPPNPPLRAVLFDFDGTLADTTELILRCYRHTMTVHLGEAPPDDEWLRGFGTPLAVQLGHFAGSAAERDAMFETYNAYQQLHHDALLRPFRGATEIVAETKRRGLGVAIVTSRLRHGTLRGMELCGLVPHVEVVVTPEDVTNPKPHPEPVLLALDQLRIAPDEALFVGDSPHDMAAGRTAGTCTAAALWGPFPRASLEAEEPDYWLEKPKDILRLLDVDDRGVR